jgi:hypothetical protein
MRHCLWRKNNNDVQAKGQALIAWKKSTRPKDQGGLGVLNLATQNLHKFFNKSNIPWVQLIWGTYYNSRTLPHINNQGSFWWKAHLKLLDVYKGMARCKPGNGISINLWADLWTNSYLNHKYPHLVTFAKNSHCSLHYAIHIDQLQDLFHLPLSQ